MGFDWLWLEVFVQYSGESRHFFEFGASLYKLFWHNAMAKNILSLVTVNTGLNKMHSEGALKQQMS